MPAAPSPASALSTAPAPAPTAWAYCPSLYLPKTAHPECWAFCQNGAGAPGLTFLPLLIPLFPRMGFLILAAVRSAIAERILSLNFLNLLAAPLEPVAIMSCS